MTLGDVSDIETVRKVALLLEAENQKLAREVAKLRREVHDLRGGDPEQLALHLAGLESQLATLRQKIFGEMSEKRPRDKTKDEEKKEAQRGHGPKAQPKLAIVEQVHIADEADKTCNACGGQLAEWNGQFEESEEIDVIERRFVITKHKRQKYHCRCGQCVETALGPVKLFAGARYSPKFAVTVAVDKYTDHMPLERQVRAMARDGLDVDSQTLWDQINALARVLEPAHERLHAHVLSQPVIGADETTWRLMGAEGKRQGGDGKKWQVWAVVAPDAVSYRILDSRSTAAAAEVLGTYDGTVLCDGYVAYESLRKQTGRFRLAHCWAHVRRKFVEIEEQHPQQCGEVLDLIGRLYGVERRAQTGPPDERLRLRSEESMPILKQIHAWALATPTLPQSGLGKAIAYMGGIWDGLKVFLGDPNVAIDNNATERALRGVVLGRKNHYGSRSRRGTEVAALFYSLIETAKLVGVGPQTYLQTATNAALRGATVPLPHELLV
jgi:transposase